MRKCNESFLKSYRYTLVYYDLPKKMGIDFEEYILLDTIIFFSKKNTCHLNVTHLERLLNMSRGSIYKYFKTLFSKYFIAEKSGKEYSLNYQIKGWLEEEKAKRQKNNEKYCVIYYRLINEYNLTLTEAMLLYMIFSMSKRKGYMYQYAKNSALLLGVSKGQYNKIKSELVSKGFIKPHVDNKLSLSLKIELWFESQEK